MCVRLRVLALTFGKLTRRSKQHTIVDHSTTLHSEGVGVVWIGTSRSSDTHVDKERRTVGVLLGCLFVRFLKGSVLHKAFLNYYLSLLVDVRKPSAVRVTYPPTVQGCVVYHRSLSCTDCYTDSGILPS